MDKLDLQSKEIVKENIDKIGELFPNVVVESEKGKSIDFDLLKQELTDILIEGNKEKYQLTWPGKKESILTANTPINKTLRPSKEESVDFDTTENIYIEGDNLEVLKLLQESYLNKIKCIYIDPPYNTGNDFIYKDNFKRTSEEELIESGQIDEEGNRLVSNNQSNGRYHSDWLSMMYPRLKLARNLLTDDGVIFISIDDNEQSNLKKLCDEIFGEENFLAQFIRKTKSITHAEKTGINNQHEYCFLYSKKSSEYLLKGENKDFSNYTNPDNDPRGPWVSGDPTAPRNNDRYEIKNPITGQIDIPPIGRSWFFSEKTINKYIETGQLKFKEKVKKGERGFIFKRYLNELKNNFNLVDSLLFTYDKFTNDKGTLELKKIFDNKVFDAPKPSAFILKTIKYSSLKNSIILDFFSGSATTAHATMQLNAEDGGNRKYIMVQLPEETDEKSEAFKAGYKNICEIGKERIQRAGKKIKEETGADIDYGFRVYKLESSNMKDVYYNPNNLSQEQLNLFESNIKEDRTSDDLLTQVLLDLGLELSLKIEEKTISNNKVYFVEDNSLVACFDEKISMDVIDEIAKYNPLKLVFRDSSFDDNSKINVSERMKRLSPETIIKII